MALDLKDEKKERLSSEKQEDTKKSYTKSHYKGFKGNKKSISKTTADKKEESPKKSSSSYPLRAPDIEYFRKKTNERLKEENKKEAELLNSQRNRSINSAKDLEKFINEKLLPDNPDILSSVPYGNIDLKYLIKKNENYMFKNFNMALDEKAIDEYDFSTRNFKTILEDLKIVDDFFEKVMWAKICGGEYEAIGITNEVFYDARRRFEHLCIDEIMLNGKSTEDWAKREIKRWRKVNIEAAKRNGKRAWDIIYRD